MEKLILKNVIGSPETASKIPQELIDALHSLTFPIGQRIPSNWQPPEGYTLEKITSNDVPIERLIPKNNYNGKVVLFFHGGAYVCPLLDNMRQLAVFISEFTGGTEVVNIDYRIAPTYRYPAALEDCITAYQYLLNIGYSNDDILFMGESAGGGLALAVTLYLKDHSIPLPKAIIAISPCTELSNDIAPSRRLNYEKDFIAGKYGTSISEQNIKQDYRGDTDFRTPYLSPLYGDYTNFPPLLLQVGTDEILYDDSLRVYEKAKATGCEVTFSSYYGMCHCFQEVAFDLPESKLAWAEIKEFMAKYFL